jgi:ribosome maturation factor RimP
MNDVTRLIEVIEPEAKALGFELVRVKLSGSGEERTLQVMAEDPATGQLVVEQCMALSRRISDRMDALEEAGEELVRGAYNLEVSSPGIDRPLTRAKDYAAWAGHEVIEDRKAGRVEVPLVQIQSAKLVLTDKLIAATRPLDIGGVEEIEETLEEEKADD